MQQDGNAQPEEPYPEAVLLKSWEIGNRLQPAPSFPAPNRDGVHPTLVEGLQKESSNPPKASPPGLMAENDLGGIVRSGRCTTCR